MLCLVAKNVMDYLGTEFFFFFFSNNGRDTQLEPEVYFIFIYLYEVHLKSLYQQ